MFYEKISRQEISSMKLDNGFSPNYTYEDYIIERNLETGEITGEFYINLTIHKTADEVYEKWLKDKENPADPVPDQNVILEENTERITILEQELITTNQYITELELMLLEQQTGGNVNGE